MDRLLSLVKPGLRVLRLVDGPGPGRQEGYEILSTLKNMQELHIEVQRGLGRRPQAGAAEVS
jgi:hypothetical protein